jgi:hypothetical protein
MIVWRWRKVHTPSGVFVRRIFLGRRKRILHLFTHLPRGVVLGNPGLPVYGVLRSSHKGPDDGIMLVMERAGPRESSQPLRKERAMHKIRRARQAERRQGERRQVEQRPFGAQVAFARVATGLGWTSLGALAIGASAAGAVAIGALAIRALAVKRGRIQRLDIEELEVGRLHVRELVVEQEQRPVAEQEQAPSAPQPSE